MTKTRTRTIRAQPHYTSSPVVVRVRTTSTHSLVRVRARRKAASRKRPTPKELPGKLRLIRERLGLSQSEIARELGLENRASISGYERGEREPPLPILLKYARLAGISTDVLIDDKLDLPKTK
jgi:DNA-binding XRE family transcriptional regulator